MYAKVIVDVPSKQTNRAFDYLVPESFKEWIEIGSRVGVPFGPRVVQGFVVALGESTDIGLGKIKEISHVLDLVPPLNQELVALSRWMSRRYLCHEVTALQAMIPGALKAKYERSLAVSEHFDAKQAGLSRAQLALFEYIKQKEKIPAEALIARFPEASKYLKDWIRAGWLNEIQLIKDRVQKKKVYTVFPAEDQAYLTECLNQLTGKAARQKELLAYLIANPQPIKLSELLTALRMGASTVKALADKHCLELKEVEVFRDPYEERQFTATSALQLTEEQTEVFREVKTAIRSRQGGVFLLKGVTGSGKTEIYLQAIQECLDLGLEAIVLVPEISLTPQMVERFKGRFGNLVAVLHSRLSQGERYDEWRKIQRGAVKVAIGARSAVFAPFTKLGLIIIDEEHEASYKQEDSPKYQAKEVAIKRAEQCQAIVMLGSATPSLESYYQSIAADARHSLRPLALTSRVGGRPLPEVKVVDMREELHTGNRSMFSTALYEGIADRLRKEEQIVLLLNRRGYSTFIMCRSCGYVVGCPHCDISLTYHQHSRNVRCHYCGYAEREPQACPECGSKHIRFFGTGTQRVEEELMKLFTGIRVIRMDVDTTSEKGSHEKWLTQFGQRQADVLLGTQMVAKGLDFPYVTLVGVIAADTVLNLPDFRAAEKTFQLLTQVAGRAGRHHLPGEVVIQTYNPEHYSIQRASRHDFQGFAQQELAIRKQRGYPPFCDLILITLSHEQIPLLIRAGESLADNIRTLWRKHQLQESSMQRTHEPATGGRNLEVLGPVASPIPRIKDRYRFQCMVKYRGDQTVVELLQRALADMEDMVHKHKLQISVDVDPQVMM